MSGPLVLTGGPFALAVRRFARAERTATDGARMDTDSEGTNGRARRILAMSLLRPRVLDDRGRRAPLQHPLAPPESQSKAARQAWHELGRIAARWTVLLSIALFAVGFWLQEPLRYLLQGPDYNGRGFGFTLRLFVLLHVLAVLVVLPTILTRQLYWKRRGRRLMLPDRRCLTCDYDLRDLPPEPDGCTVCPECGAAWKLGDRRRVGGTKRRRR